MEGGEEEASSPKSNPRSSSCQECDQNPAKYTCPGCSLRTCSLPCVKSHKQRTSCNGKRPRTAFVPLSQFDDNLLISDYNFLEEAKRAAESAQRVRLAMSRNSGFRLPPRLKQLRNAAGRRKTRLLFLSSGLERREKNQTMFHQRKKSILWTIEWRFHSTNVVLLEHRVDEHASLVHVIEKHLKPGPWNHQLKPFCQEPLAFLKFFIRKNPKGLKSPYRELDIRAPISQQLSDIVIVEYPSIDIFLPSHRYDFEVEKYTKISSKDMKAAESPDDIPGPKGVLFREEEINEEDGAFDTQVMDFSQEPVVKDRGKERETSLSTQPSEGINPVSENEQPLKDRDMNEYFHCNIKEPETLKDGDFEFEQDLRDAYSKLIGQVNLDDFLCLDDESVEVELEEGEIVEF